MPEKLRRARRLICAAALVTAAALLACAALVLFHQGQSARLADPALPIFTRDGVLQALHGVRVPLVICAAVTLVCILWAAADPDKPQRSRPARPAAQSPVPHAGRIRLALYLVAAALIIAGALNGGLRDVLVKAINICTECIGLG